MIRRSTPIEQLNDYCESVLSGDTVACKAAIKVVERFVRDIERSKDDEFPYYFDEDVANMYCRMIPAVFKHFEGELAGKPIELQPWQMFLFANLFAWKRKSDHKRRFRKALVTMGRKGGKSIVAGVVEIILAGLDGEAAAQVYSTATKMDQAKIVHRMVELMVKASPALVKASRIMKNNIKFPGDSFCRPLGSDRAFDGTNIHAVVFDELHAWEEFHRPFYQTQTSASGTRTQPLQFIISTAGLDDKSYIYNEELDYARGILDQTIEDDREFVMIFELDEEHDFLAEDFDVSLMEQANPNMGVSVPVEFYEDKLKVCRQKPSEVKTFKLKFANQSDKSFESLMTTEEWDAIAGELSDWRESDGIGAGVDLGGRDDLAAYAVTAKFRIGDLDDETPVYRYETRSVAFIAENCKRDLTAEPFATWIKNKNLIVSEYPTTELKSRLIKDCEELGIEYVAYDPYQFTQLAEDLENEGIKPVKMPQTRSHFNETLAEYHEAVAENRFKPDEGDPVLRWCATNMVVNRDPQGRVMPDKAKSKQKIDAAVAMLMSKKACNKALPKETGSLVL